MVVLIGADHPRSHIVRQCRRLPCHTLQAQHRHHRHRRHRQFQKGGGASAAPELRSQALQRRGIKSGGAGRRLCARRQGRWRFGRVPKLRRLRLQELRRQGAEGAEPGTGIGVGAEKSERLESRRRREGEGSSGDRPSGHTHPHPQTFEGRIQKSTERRTKTPERTRPVPMERTLSFKQTAPSSSNSKQSSSTASTLSGASKDYVQHRQQMGGRKHKQTNSPPSGGLGASTKSSGTSSRGLGRSSKSLRIHVSS